MGKVVIWTEEDKKLLTDSVYNLSKEEILSLFPQRTWKAIRDMSLKLGLKLINNYEPILENELFKIIDDIKHMKCKSCRRYLPFNMNYYPKDKNCKTGYRSICKECKGEKFGTKDFWTNEEIKIIKEFYEIMTNKEIQTKFLPNRSIQQIGGKGLYLRLTKSKELKLKAREGLNVGENNPMYGIARKGSENPNWRGGTSELYNHLRNSINDWKTMSMKTCGYKCVITGERFDDIHHTYSFVNIVKDTLTNLGLPINQFINEYSEDELNLIEKECMRIHMENIGVCLRKDVHILFHQIYGKHDNTLEQFECFKSDYQTNKYYTQV